MSRTQRLFALAGILLLATFFRFYQQRSLPPGLYPDEAMNGNNMVEVAETGQWKPFYPENNGREGLYIDTLVLMYRVWPVETPWFERLPAEVAGVLTVAGVYCLMSELLGPGVGLLAAFLTATGLWPITISRLGFRANFCVLLLVWAVFLLVKGLRAHHRAWLWMAGAGVLYGLAYYTYIPIRLTPVLLLVFVPFFWRRAGFWKSAAVFVVVTLIVVAPLARYFVQHPEDFVGRAAQISVTSSDAPVKYFVRGLLSELAMLNYHGDRNWRHNIGKAPELFLPVGLLFWAGFIAAVRRLWAWWRHGEGEGLPAALLLVWFFVGMVPAAAAMEVPSALRSVLMIPPVMALAAFGGVLVVQRVGTSWGRRWTAAVVAVFCIVVCVHSYIGYFRIWAHSPQVQPAFNAQDVPVAAAINALPRAVPKYVVIREVPGLGFWTRGLPVTAATVEFLTHSFTDKDRAERNIHYLPHGDRSTIPAGTPEGQVFTIGGVPQ